MQKDRTQNGQGHNLNQGALKFNKEVLQTILQIKAQTQASG